MCRRGNGEHGTDQFMRLGWKVLVPGGLLRILIIFAIRTYRTSGTGNVTALLVAVGIGLAVVLVVVFLVPGRRVEEPVIELASDYPVPPLNLTVPTPSRHELRPRPIAPEREEPVRLSRLRQVVRAA